jgi:hypothetical protein
MGVALKAIVRPLRLPPSTPCAGVLGLDPVLPVTLPSEIPSEAYRILASLFKSLDSGHSPMRHAPGMHSVIACISALSLKAWSECERCDRVGWIVLRVA